MIKTGRVVERGSIPPSPNGSFYLLYYFQIAKLRHGVYLDFTLRVLLSI